MKKWNLLMELIYLFIYSFNLKLNLFYDLGNDVAISIINRQGGILKLLGSSFSHVTNASSL